MKKLVLVLTFLSVSVTLFASGRWGQGPETTGGAAVFPEYGGFQYSTSTFALDGATIAGTCDVLGVLFTTGTTGAFVSIYDSTTTTGGLVNQQEIFRVYNVANSTASVWAGGISGGFNPCFGAARGSIHIFKNLIWNVSSAVFNRVTLIYNKE